ncbi:MAG: TonB-dependent receptor domain-containing protein, partial [Pseudomonadales bacterium]
GFTDLNPFRGGALLPPYDIAYAELEKEIGGDLSALNLVNPGTGTLDGSDVLVSPEDKLNNEVVTLYLDLLATTTNDWQLKQQLFFEHYDNLNENTYGFSQFHDSWVIEAKQISAKTFALNSLAATVQISPSVRHTNFEHGDDYTNEHFDRRDLTGPSNALDKRVLATQIDDDYTEYYIGEYTDIGFALMADLVWNSGFNALLGIRYDAIDVESRQPADKLLFASADNFCTPPGGCANLDARNEVEGVSWTVSLSYDTPVGLVPYITASKQATMIVGQGAEATTDNVMSGEVFDDSKLLEGGLKGSLLDDSLYFALSIYRQERTDFSAQSIVTNQATETEGAEFEIRWVVNEKLLLTFGYSDIEVTNINTERDGSRFSFIGCDDLPSIPCHMLYGGTLVGNISSAPSGAKRAGVPKNILSFTGTYDFANGWTLNGSVIDVDEVAGSFSNSVTLPAYTLVNLGFAYETENWLFSASGKNLTDERYFRSNFPNLFGGVIVLPELPRHYNARLQYSF